MMTSSTSRASRPTRLSPPPGQPGQHGVVVQDPALAVDQADAFRDRVDGQLPLMRRRADGDLGEPARASERTVASSTSGATGSTR